MGTAPVWEGCRPSHLLSDPCWGSGVLPLCPHPACQVESTMPLTLSSRGNCLPSDSSQSHANAPWRCCLSSLFSMHWASPKLLGKAYLPYIAYALLNSCPTFPFLGGRGDPPSPPFSYPSDTCSTTPLPKGWRKD